VLLRGLGRLTMFPGDDVGARTNLARCMKRRKPLDYDRVRQLARRWQPYAGFLYFHVLLQSLAEAGQLGSGGWNVPPKRRPPPFFERVGATYARSARLRAARPMM